MDLVLNNHFILKNKPSENANFVLFVDDSSRHFNRSNIVLGLLVKRELKPTLKLSKRALERWQTESRDFETYDNSLGISIGGFDALKKFVKLNFQNIHSITLDWDNTLTVHSTFRSAKIDKYVAECYFGGLQRMKKIKSFFRMCRKKNIFISVLTCNGRAKTMEGQRAFLEALKWVDARNINVNFTDKSKISYIERHYEQVKI